MSNRIILLVLITIILCSALGAFASITVHPAATNKNKATAEEIGKAIEEARKMNLADFKQLNGGKLTLMEKAVFRKAQKQLSGKYANISSSEIAAELELKNGETRNTWALAFLLGPLGVLTAYLIEDDKRQERRKYLWRGVLMFLLVTVALAVIYGDMSF